MSEPHGNVEKYNKNFLNHKGIMKATAGFGMIDGILAKIFLISIYK